jgi:competence protein ComEC
VLVPAVPFAIASAAGADHPAAANAAGSQKALTSTASSTATIEYVDVGQGDGVVMLIGGRLIVSDAGQRNADVLEQELERLRPGDKTVDFAILSHPHSDHVRNFLTLIDDGWKIKTAVMSESAWWTATKTNKSLMDALTSQGTALQQVVVGQHFSWGGADWEILNPPKGKYTTPGQVPDASVAYVLKVNGDEFLFTGDIGESVASAVADRWTSEGLGSATVFLATHHGSATGSTAKLLDAIEPVKTKRWWAVLSTGPNSYGHPTEAAIGRLEKHGATIWCTNANGTIRATVFGSGRIAWHATKESTAWWSGGKSTGSCVGHPLNK